MRARGHRRRFVATLIALAAASVGLAVRGPVPVGAAPVAARLAGGDAPATAVAVSRAGWTSSAEAVVVAATGWTDALAASALGLPILLVNRDAVPQSTGDELRRLGARRLWVIGGTNAIGPAVRDRLRSGGAALTEISGADRYDTAGRLAAALGTTGGDVVVASGEAWADAASVGAWAAARRVPIYLTRRDSLPRESRGATSANRTVVVGGPNVVSDAVVGQLPNPVRLAGADRYDTNVAVATWAAADGVGFTRPVLAPGGSPMDALVAGPLAARRGSTVVLSPPDRLPLATQHELVLRADGVVALAVVGGPGQIGDSAVDDTVSAVKAADLLAWVNDFRAANGRGRLPRDRELTERAYTHAVTLALQGRLFHQSAKCGTWGENVGTYPDPRTVFDVWTRHSSHRTVMLMSSVVRAGTAVVTGADGRRWVVLDVCG